jgi:hypothetical protein
MLLHQYKLSIQIFIVGYDVINSFDRFSFLGISAILLSKSHLRQAIAIVPFIESFNRLHSIYD